MSGARNWKWMVPGAWFGLFLLVTRSLLASDTEWVRWMALFPGVVTAICAVATVGNFYDYRRELSTSFYERRQNAMSRTPLASELEGARGVHPDVARMLIRERKRAWMLRGQGRNDVLFNAPNVTDIFVVYFLQNSTEGFVMPKRKLVEGRINRFDPGGAVTEYEMYDDLVKVLSMEGKIHRWSEFSPWEWVKPWGPRSTAEDYRLEVEWDDEVVNSPEPVGAEAV